MEDFNDMLGDPAQWEIEQTLRGLPISAICDIGNGAIRLQVEAVARGGWRAIVRGANRRITVDHLESYEKAKSEAHSQAIRMVQDIKDQMDWLLESECLKPVEPASRDQA